MSTNSRGEKRFSFIFLPFSLPGANKPETTLNCWFTVFFGSSSSFYVSALRGFVGNYSVNYFYSATEIIAKVLMKVHRKTKQEIKKKTSQIWMDEAESSRWRKQEKINPPKKILISNIWMDSLSSSAGWGSQPRPVILSSCLFGRLEMFSQPDPHCQCIRSVATSSGEEENK